MPPSPMPRSAWRSPAPWSPPEDLATFPSSPRFVGYVHLLTLGFLASAVYGAIYAFAPSVLRLPIAERRLDLLAFVLHAGGTMAMVHGLAAASPWQGAPRRPVQPGGPGRTRRALPVRPIGPTR